MPREAPSPQVFLHISTDFTPTREIPLSPTSLQISSFGRTFGVKPRDFTTDLKIRLITLYAQ